MPTSSDAPVLAAVLFDMDGTLVDTEPYWIAAEYALVAEFGGTWSDEHAHAVVGNPLLVTGAYLHDVGRVPLDPPAIVERLMDDVIARVHESMPWRPGARELLLQCAEAGLPTALVTMSYRRLARTVLDAVPAGTFTTAVTGDEVRHGKPDPEAYRTACERLAVAPGTAVAIEDSPTGIASAEAAGCVTVGVPHQVPVDPAPTRTLLPTLDGVTVADLATLVRDRAVSSAG